jgi:hypothetical protein
MILNENLDHHDLVGQIIPTVSIDEYAAQAGSDDEIITIAFTVKGEQASQDLSDWFERGYDWILDAEVSEGEYTPGRNLVFVEIPRRTTAPARIIELIDDLETLTDIPLTEWTIKFDGEDYDPDVEQLKSLIIMSPHDYRIEHEEDLNEMREIAGLPAKNAHGKQDKILRDFMAKAGL